MRSFPTARRRIFRALAPVAAIFLMGTATLSGQSDAVRTLSELRDASHIDVSAYASLVPDKFMIEPSLQPEPPSLFLRRMQAELDRARACERLVDRLSGELDTMKIPEFKLRDATMKEAIDRINKVILAHNREPGAYKIPIVTIDPAISKPPDSWPVASAPNHLVVDSTSYVIVDGTALEPVPPKLIPPGRQTITLALTDVTVMEAIMYVTELSNKKLHIDPNEVRLEPAATSGPYEAIRRSYIVPRTILATGAQAKKVLDSINVEYVGFDGRRHILTVYEVPWALPAFEIWYARELLKHGYPIPRSEGN